MTILLTTHYLDEAQRLCDRVAIMHEGAIAGLDTPDRLLAALGERDPRAPRRRRRRRGAGGAARPRDRQRRRVRDRVEAHRAAARPARRGRDRVHARAAAKRLGVRHARPDARRRLPAPHRRPAARSRLNPRPRIERNQHMSAIDRSPSIALPRPRRPRRDERARHAGPPPRRADRRQPPPDRSCRCSARPCSR